MRASGRRVAVAMVVLCLAYASPANAQLSADRREALAVMLEQAGEELSPERIPRVDEAAERVQRDYQRLADYLRSTTNPANAQAWLDYVNFQELVDAWAREDAAVEQGRVARDIYWRLTRNQQGLERPAVGQLRDSLQQFIAAVMFRDAESTLPAIDRQLDNLAGLLRNSGDMLLPEESATINRILLFLDASGLVPEVVRSLREAIGQPNVRLMIGQSLVAELINRPIDRTAPTDECILGTRVIGTAHLDGQVTATPIPSDGAARVLLSMGADFSSLGTGYQKAVRVRTRGYGHVTAQRVLTIDDRGVTAEGVFATASLGSQILGIQHHMRLVRRIAARRAEELKPRANAIAAGRLRQRVASEFAEETGEQISGGGLLPRAQIDDVLRRIDLEEPGRQWGSTHQYLTLGLTVGEPRQTTTTVPPPLVSNPYDIVIQIHESAVDNVASLVLAERALRETQLSEFANSLFPNLRPLDPLEPVEVIVQPSEEQIEDEEPFRIQFSALRPVIFEARDGLLRVGIRGSRFEQGERVLDQPLEIAAQYAPVRQEDGSVILVRQGPVRVSFPGGGTRRLSISQVALRRNLEERFTEVFPETLFDNFSGFPAPVRRPGAPNAPGMTLTLRPRAIVANDGWLTIALK